jgi:hypothetical protein
LPVPETVDWTMPFSAVTIWVEVRAELVGAPIWATARTAIATTATASVYRCQGRFLRLLMVRLPVVDLRAGGGAWLEASVRWAIDHGINVLHVPE